MEIQLASTLRSFSWRDTQLRRWTSLYTFFFSFLWRNNANQAQAASLLRFIDHIHIHSVGLLCTCDQPVAEAAAYTTNTREWHLCRGRDSNPRFQQSNGCRTTPWTTRLPGSAQLYIYLDKSWALMQLFEALRYKPEGRGFDSPWCHWNISLT
jgi:hypothetical protein